MRNEGLVTSLELRKAISQLKADGQLFEVRVLQDTGGKKSVLSGYFKEADTLLKAMDTIDLRHSNVYITINSILPELESRQQSGRFVKGAQTTNDKEVVGYDWLFIDLDPVRASGISSTAEELQEAAELAQKVYIYLKGIGFEEPVKAFSGNGYHLLYKIHVEANEANVKLIERCLKALSNMFSTDAVKVDTTNYNPSRICKLYGTLAQKGTNTITRPHRMARLDGEVKQVVPTSRIYLEKLADIIPQEEVKPAKYNNYSPSEFDLEEFLDRNGVSYNISSGEGCKVYRLDECPFNSNHRNGDSKVFHYSNGAIAFKCHHDSCSNYRWQDVRQLFDPDCYDNGYDREAVDRAIEEGWKKHNRDKAPEEMPANNGSIWQTVSEILAKPTPDNEYVLTGIAEIDRRMHGLLKSGISVWSGLRASAKSTLLSQIALRAVNDDHNVLMYSGELTDKRFTRWLLQQGAGRQYMTEKTDKNGSHYWVVPNDIQARIAAWISDRLFLYNNLYGSDYGQLMAHLEQKIQFSKPDLVIMDNLMTVDVSSITDNEYRAQTELMKNLKRLAETYNCHIALVAHPRKTVSFLRLVDIAGSANIQNLVDSAFIVHRVNHDFQKGYLEEFCDKGTKAEDILLFKATNVVEIAKDREEGIQDVFVPLWYCTSSRQLRNSNTEVIKYKWTTEWSERASAEGFMDVQEGEIPKEWEVPKSED